MNIFFTDEIKFCNIQDTRNRALSIQRAASCNDDVTDLYLGMNLVQKELVFYRVCLSELFGVHDGI